MSGALRPRQTAYRGSVLASGVLLDTRLVGEEQARARILHLGRNGLAVFRLGPLLVVRFREPERLGSRTAVGAPLVRYGRLHASAPLEDDELRSFDGVAESVVLVEGSVASSMALDGDASEDISRWIDVSRFEPCASGVSLGEVVSFPQSRWSAASDDVRQPFGMAPMGMEGASVVASLKRGTRGAPASGAAGTADVVGFLARALEALRSLIAPLATPETTSSSTGLAVRAAGSGGPSWLAKLRAGLQHLAARLLVWSRLAPLVGREQAKYVAKMLEMFDANDLDGALRHAIPLSHDVQLALKPPALRTPAPRTDFAIVPGRASPETSLGLGGDLFALLKAKYRRAFERLVEQGDVEKAAFVLAELLHSSEEAVSFLERHGRLKLAAEVAEARGLAPGLVVRQWFLAGNKERAIQVARRTGAFADAIARLERTHKAEGRVLRLVWADSLAEAGAYAGAVDAVWPVEDARGLASEWLERAIAVGGGTGARMLIRKVRLLPDAFADVRDRALALLEEGGDDGRRVVLAMGRELTTGAPTDGTRVLARVVARALLAVGRDKDAERLLQALLDAAGDAVFRADVAACNQSASASPPAVRIRASAFTHAGRVRARNEDACLVAFLSEGPKVRAIDGDAGRRGVVLGAFDGTGGHAAGGIASALAIRVTSQALQREFANHGANAVGWARRLATAVEDASREIFREATTRADRRGMGCAATVATLCGGTLFVAQIGDTRGYVLRNGQLVQVTKEHTLLNEVLAGGHALSELDRDALETHKNVITRAMGVAADVSADLVRVELRRDDVILLCSDGLYSVVGDAEIWRALLGKSPEAAGSALLAAALAAGAPDNVAIVVAQVSGAELLPAEGEPVHYAPVVPTAMDGAPFATELRSRSTPLVVRRAAADTGALVVHDAAELPDGRMLVALGEVGVWLLSRDGKVLVRFAEPAHRLVLSDHGDRAILVAFRGEAYRLARLDLLTRRVRPWCDARIDRFSPDFDGATWYVSRGDTVFVIDALSREWEHLWMVDERGARVIALQRDARTVSVLLEYEHAHAEVWTFDTPSHTLRARQQVSVDEVKVVYGSTSAAGRIAGYHVIVDVPGDTARFVPSIQVHNAWKDAGLTIAEPLGAPCITNEWVAFPVLGPEGMVVHLFDSISRRERAVVHLDGPTGSEDEPRGGLRLQEDRMVVFDPRGRVLVLSLKTGDVLREFRIS